jgi:U3 small nucleolar RNA-associated protein 10
MSSSLAQQLAKNASLNAALYVDRSRRKATQSYLFTGRDADEYDLETIYSIGVNSFLHLASICPPLEAYEEVLFSERAKNTDRTLLSPDAIAELDKALEEFLALLGPYLMEAPTGRVLEFLVRRFRRVLICLVCEKIPNSSQEYKNSISTPSWPSSYPIMKPHILPK